MLVVSIAAIRGTTRPKETNYKPKFAPKIDLAVFSFVSRSQTLNVLRFVFVSHLETLIALSKHAHCSFHVFKGYILCIENFYLLQISFMHSKHSLVGTRANVEAFIYTVHWYEASNTRSENKQNAKPVLWVFTI